MNYLSAGGWLIAAALTATACSASKPTAPSAPANRATPAAATVSSQQAQRSCAQTLTPQALQLDNVLQQLPGVLSRLATATPDASAIADLGQLNAQLNTINGTIQAATCDPAAGDLLTTEKQASAAYAAAISQMYSGMRASDQAAIRAATQQLTNGQAILQRATSLLNAARSSP